MTFLLNPVDVLPTKASFDAEVSIRDVMVSRRGYFDYLIVLGV